MEQGCSVVYLQGCGIRLEIIMGHVESVRNCTTFDELFKLWENKQPQYVDYYKKDGVNSKYIDHKNSCFIRDGIVNQDIWNDTKHKRILFVLKEAYGVEWKEDYSLNQYIHERSIQYKIWRRIAHWTYGIERTDINRIEAYRSKLLTGEYREALDQIAVMNIKKSDGNSSSDYDELTAYADYDKAELKKEFELIDPEIVICGYTFKRYLYKILTNKEWDDKDNCDNWFYFTNLDGKQRLYIDSYHPANHWSNLMNYYTIVSLYQQALIATDNLKKCTLNQS